MGRVLHLLFLCVLFGAGGCTPLALRSGDFGEATVRTSLARAGIVDRQTEFAALFCAHYAQLAPAGGGCAQWLQTMPAGAGGEGRVPAAGGARPVVVIIPGIFGECVSRWVTPFSADYGYLEKLGYRVLVVPVTGRGSSLENAGIIHRFFVQHAFESAVVIGYSKGVTDFMTAANLPQAGQWAQRIKAFVSVAGVVNGTVLASRGAALYRHVAGWQFPTCGPADGGGVASLSYASVLPVAQAYARLGKPYPSYSVAAIADGAANPLLQGAFDLLATVDRRNDGQVLAEDAILPGSVYLGAFRADHWSIVLPFEDSDEALMRPFGVNNHFPRRVLVTALLDFVNR
jgi:pimeloyl-ACP methyl ester carboxylesterase